jgi:hypothetical protein
MFLSKKNSEALIALGASHRFEKPVRSKDVAVECQGGILKNHVTVDGITHSFDRKQAETMVNKWLETLGSRKKIWAHQGSTGKLAGKIVLFGHALTIKEILMQQIQANEAGPGVHVDEIKSENFAEEPRRPVVYYDLGGERYFVLSNSK